MLVDNGGAFFDVFRAKHPDRYKASIIVLYGLLDPMIISSSVLVKLNDFESMIVFSSSQKGCIHMLAAKYRC